MISRTSIFLSGITKIPDGIAKAIAKANPPRRPPQVNILTDNGLYVLNRLKPMYEIKTLKYKYR